MNIYKKAFISIGLIVALCLMFCCDKRPKAPTNLVAMEIDKGGEIAIALSFDDNSNNEDSFLVYRNGELLGNAYLEDIQFMTWLAGVDYVDSTVVAGMIYDYQIKAINEHGFSESNIATIQIEVPTIPSAPTDITAIEAFHSIKLEWQDNSDNEDGFQIFNYGHGIADLPENTTSFIDSNLDYASIQLYSIYLYNKAGQSNYSGIETKTLGQWKCIWNKSVDYREIPIVNITFSKARHTQDKGYEIAENGFAEGYNVYIVLDGLPSLIYTGPDTSFLFKRPFYPCIMVEAFDGSGNMSKLTEVVCAKVE